MAWFRRLALYLAFLRLPFQLTLAPIFLWGALLSDGGWDDGTSCAFVALHLLLYPAATAFNSAFDRDRGPVAGLAQPPDVPPGLARFAVLLALAGVPLALAAGAAFAGLYALIAGWTTAYSHPRTRWKASPRKSAAAIALGQGALGFAAGWFATAGAPDASAATFTAGAAATALTALGLYPLTQIFQLEEDWERGDRTLAIALGPARALRLGAVCMIGAAVLNGWLVAARYGPSDAFLLSCCYAVLVIALERIARRPPLPKESGLYRPAMRLLNWATAGFLLFLALEAVGNG